jgi:hypothetical protein
MYLWGIKNWATNPEKNCSFFKKKMENIIKLEGFVAMDDWQCEGPSDWSNSI